MKTKGGDKMFNYSKLEGRIVEYFKTRKNFAEALDLNYGTLTSRLRGDSNFTSEEIIKISNALKIEKSHIDEYFFVQKV